jgi:MoxR-like ATPase
MLEYTGKLQPQVNEVDFKGQKLYPYLPEPDMVEAVNLAIFLERPLLLKGEPGCGKTQLARAVAYELKLPFEAWYVKSTSKARDSLYTYDTIGRLRDAQLTAYGGVLNPNIPQINNPAAYIRWGPLGRAFQNNQRTVVLIDEIDKADIDFPNDLLLEIEEKRFIIEEIGQEIKAQFPPIIFITSNDERDLPNAFLRRCLFHYIDFPNNERLIQIINGHFPDSEENLVKNAVQKFQELREELQNESEFNKQVSTSELIDWFRVLRRYPNDEVLAQLNNKVPYLGVLLKNWDSHIRYLRKNSVY